MHFELGQVEIANWFPSLQLVAKVSDLAIKDQQVFIPSNRGFS